MSEDKMRVKTLKTHDYHPPEPENHSTTVALIAGEEYTIKRAWGEALVKLGVVEEIAAPTRAPKP